MLRKYLVLLLMVCSLTGVALAETSVENSYSKSYNYEKMEKYDDAIKALMRLYQQYPKGYTLNLRLGWLYYLKGSYTNSIKHYKVAMTIAPNSLQAKLGLTLPLMAQKKWADTEKLLYNVLKVDYYNYYGNLRLAYVLRIQGNTELAVQVSKKMLGLYPTDVSFLIELGWTYFAQNNIKNATSVFSSVKLLDPENVSAKEYFKE